MIAMMKKKKKKSQIKNQKKNQKQLKKIQNPKILQVMKNN